MERAGTRQNLEKMKEEGKISLLIRFFKLRVLILRLVDNFHVCVWARQDRQARKKQQGKNFAVLAYLVKWAKMSLTHRID